MADHVELHAATDVEAYAEHVLAFLSQDPVQRNVLLSVIAQARSGFPGWAAPPSFWWLSSGHDIVGAASWTPPFSLLVSAMPPEGAVALAPAALGRAAAIGARLRGATGPRETARAVADALARRAGTRAQEHMRMLVHELREIRDVPVPAGRPRLARGDDATLATRWMRAFNDEAHAGSGADVDAAVHAAIDAGRLWLWIDGDEPRCMVGSNPAVGSIVRVGPVYTPPPHRNCGYARRLVHVVSAHALNEPGIAGCTLNTDLTNPVSNANYAQVGYVPVAEHSEFALIP